MRKVLRVRRSDPLSPDEAINGSPVCAAKLFERFLCCWRFALRLQHHAPVRRGKCRAVISIFVARTQRRHAFLSRGHKTIELKFSQKASMYRDIHRCSSNNDRRRVIVGQRFSGAGLLIRGFKSARRIGSSIRAVLFSLARSQIAQQSIAQSHN